MAALVVSISQAGATGRAGERIGIFPGGATPAVHPADTAFWIGYGFAPEPEASAGAPPELGDETRFELDVDGFPVDMRTELQVDGTAPLRKTDLAEFPEGLRAGWHEFVGRWYDAGKLILSSRASIEFVER